MKTNTFTRSLRTMLAALLTGILFTFFTPAANAQSNGEVSSEVRTEVEQLNKDIEKFIEKKDYASIIDLYSDDATIMVSGGTKIQGRKAIADYWYALTSAKNLKSEITELGGNGKIVYQIGKWTITTLKDGVEKTITTDVVLVWKRQQSYGSYKIQLNSSNNPVAATALNTDGFKAETK